MKEILLNDGQKMPMLGYGTYRVGAEEAERCVTEALEIGYRLIDTATFYGNEAGVGEALSHSALPREAIFLTTKLWTDVDCAQKVYRTAERSLKLLKTDYLNLLLIHWPTKANAEVFEAMLELKRQGVVRSAGVSNFKEHHIEALKQACGEFPALNQVELHPLFQQPELTRFCRERGIAVQAWSPLLRGRLFDDPVLGEIASAHRVGVAQVILRYDLQRGISVIPKSVTNARMRENFDLFSFSLTAEELADIAALDTGCRQFRDPDNHGF